jgi:hypothetical protein
MEIPDALNGKKKILHMLSTIITSIANSKLLLIANISTYVTNFHLLSFQQISEIKQFKLHRKLNKRNKTNSWCNQTHHTEVEDMIQKYN